MLDGLEDGGFDLSNSAKGVFFQFFNRKGLIDIFAEIHPFDPLFPISFGLDCVDPEEFFELGIGEGEVEGAEYPLELQAGHDVLPQSVEVDEELAYPQSF